MSNTALSLWSAPESVRGLESVRRNPSWRLGAHTAKGQLRGHNEDACGLNSELGLALVADGMGGYNVGDVASSTAIKVASDWISSHGDQPEVAAPDQPTPSVRAAISALLIEAVSSANAALLAAAARRPECLGMGSTLLVTRLFGRFLSFAHVGDSRLYLLRGAQLHRLTRDHAQGEQAELRGSDDLMANAARVSRQRHRQPARQRCAALTRMLGLADFAQPDSGTVELAFGDRILLCSDGISDVLLPFELASHMAQAVEPAACAVRLVDAAHAAGGHDDASAALIFFDAPTTGA